MENDRKCKLSRLRLKNNTAKKNDSTQPESSQISKYFMRNREIPDIITINDDDVYTERKKFNDPNKKSPIQPSCSSNVDLEDENEFGEREPPQCFDDSVLDLKFPVHKLKSKDTKPKMTSTKSRPKRGQTKIDKRQPKIKNALTKQPSYEEKYSKILNQQLLADKFNPDDLQVAIALSNSINEQYNSNENENNFPDTQERMRNIKTTLEQFGFKNSKSASSETNIAPRQRLRDIRKGSILLSRKQSDREKIIEKNVSDILNEDQNIDRAVESPMKFRLVCDDLMNLEENNILFNIHKSNLSDDISTYSIGIVGGNFSEMGLLLKNWNDIPGRDKSPEYKQKSNKIENAGTDVHKNITKRKRLTKITTENKDSSLGQSFSNYSKIVKGKNRVILDTNILDTSVEFLDRQPELSEIESHNNNFSEINVTMISDEPSSVMKNSKHIADTDSKQCVNKSMKKINKEENESLNKSKKLLKKELRLSPKLQRCISPNLFDDTDEDEIIESSLLNKAFDESNGNNSFNDSMISNKIIHEKIEKDTVLSENNSVDSLELRANANVDYDLPRNKNKSFNITLERYLVDIKKVKNPLSPELDVMDSNIPNLSDFSEDSLILCEPSSNGSNISTSSEDVKKFKLNYDKFGASSLRKNKKKLFKSNSSPKLKSKNIRNLKCKTKSISQMEKEFLGHLTDDSIYETKVKEPFVQKTLKVAISQSEKTLCDEKSPGIKLKRTSAIRNVFKKRSVDPINQKSLSSIDLSAGDDTLNISEILAKKFYGPSTSRIKTPRQSKFSLSLSQNRDSNKISRCKSSLFSPDISRSSRDKSKHISHSSDHELIISSSSEDTIVKKSIKNRSIPLYESDDSEETNLKLNIVTYTSHTHIGNMSSKNKEEHPLSSPNTIKSTSVNKSLTKTSINTDNQPKESKKNRLSENSDDINKADEILQVSSEDIMKERKSSPRDSSRKIRARSSYRSPISLSDDQMQSSISLSLENEDEIAEAKDLYPKVLCWKDNEEQLQSSDSDEFTLNKRSFRRISPIKKMKLSHRKRSSSITNIDIIDAICLSDSEDVDLQIIKSPKNSSSVKKEKRRDFITDPSVRKIFSASIREIFMTEPSEDDFIKRKNRNSFKFSSTLNKSDLKNDIINLSQLNEAPLQLSTSSENSPPAKKSLLSNFNTDANLEMFLLSDDDNVQTPPKEKKIGKSNFYESEDKTDVDKISGNRSSLSNDDEDELAEKLSQNSSSRKSKNGNNTSIDISGSDDDVLVISDEELNYSISTPYKSRRNLLLEKSKFSLDTPNQEETNLKKSAVFDESISQGNSKQNLEQDSCSSYDEMKNYFPFDSEEYLKSPVIENIDTQESSKANNSDIPNDSIDPFTPERNVNKTLNISLVNILESPRYAKYLEDGEKPKPKRLTQLKGTPGASTGIVSRSTPVSSNEIVDFDNTDFELNQLCEEVCLSYVEKLKDTSESESNTPSDNQTPRREKDPFISSPNTPTILVIPDDCPYEVRKHNVTPKPDFERMKTPERLEMLNKFGIKKLKRKPANEILEYIYDQTHPIGQITPEKKKRRMATRSKGNDAKSDEDNDYPVSDYYVCASDKKDAKNSGAACFTPEKVNEEYYLPSRSKSKLIGCVVPLHISFFNFVAERTDIREQILRYDPIELDEVHIGLKQQGYRYDPKDLLTFMDKRCITVKTKNRVRKEKTSGGSQSQTRKKPTKEQTTKDSALCMESVDSNIELCSQMRTQESAFSSSSGSSKDWHHEKRFKPIEISDSE